MLFSAIPLFALDPEIRMPAGRIAFRLRDSEDTNLQWLYNPDDTHFVDEQEGWKSNTRDVFDISDAGMAYWLVTGGPDWGNYKGGWREVKALFGNQNKIKTLERIEVDSVRTTITNVFVQVPNRKMRKENKEVFIFKYLI